MAREQQLEAKEREERRREREELREKHRLGLKAFVQAKRDAKTQDDDLPDAPPADLDLAFVSDDVFVPSVFKFVVAQAPPSSRPGSAKKASVATPRPLSANKRSPPSNVKGGVGSTPTPTSSVKLANPQRSISKEEREKSRELLKIAMQAARKNGLAAKGGEVGIEIYTPSRDPPLQQQQQPSRSLPRTASSSASPASPRTAGRRAARPVDLYSTREIDIANQAELDARVYKLEADKRELSIHDLDIEDTDDDDDDSVEHDLSGIADLCDQFDFDAQNLSSTTKGKKNPSVLAQFNTTLKHIFASSNDAALLNDTNNTNSKSVEPSPPLEEAESPIGSASVDYHAMIRIMEQVMRNTSKVLPSSAAAAADSATSEIETALGIGSSDPADANFLNYDDEDDDTFGEDEEAYILLGTPDKERSTEKSDISPILRGTVTSMLLEDEMRSTLPIDNDNDDDDDDAPPTYEEAARLGPREGSGNQQPEFEEAEEEEGEGEFPYDVKDLGVGLSTITALPDPEHAAYLTEFLTEMFGQEKLEQALSLLRNSLSTSPAKKVGSHDADEEDMLLSNLEQILGTQGLGHIDDLFFLVQSE